MGRAALLLLALAALAGGCATPRVADPRSAVRAYAAAARRGDGPALHALLTRRSQRELGLAGTTRLVADARRELAAQATGLERAEVRVEAVAVVRYDDGEYARLELEDGVFKVSSAASLPSSAQTPAQALGDLRRALSRRSYTAFLRVLAAETQSALESDLSSIVRGLEDPETLNVEVQGDAADVELPGGHVIKLKREGGVWRVEDVK